MKSQLPFELKRELTQFFSKQEKVESVILFGSRARGDAEQTSDVDLSIHAPRASIHEWSDIVYFLTERVRTLLPFNVVRWEDASPALKKNIRKEGKRLYARS